MKKIGIIVFIVGLIMTALSGFDLITRENIIEIGNVEIAAKKSHVFDWSSLLGVCVMAVGAGLYLLPRKSLSGLHIN